MTMETSNNSISFHNSSLIFYSIYVNLCMYWLVVWNILFFPYIGNVIIPTDFHIFQRGRYTTNQIYMVNTLNKNRWVHWYLYFFGPWQPWPGKISWSKLPCRRPRQFCRCFFCAEEVAGINKLRFSQQKHADLYIFYM